MKVSDLCVCDVTAVTRETTLARAGALMRKNNVGALPVVTSNDRVIGMVTDRDCFIEIAQRNASPSEVYVDEAMNGRPAVCSADDDVLDCLETMKRNRVRRIPVVDGEDRLQGILSIDDIACHAFEERGRDIPFEDVIEALSEITQDYRAETESRQGAGRAGGNGGEHARRARGRQSAAEESGRRGRSSEAEEEPGRRSRMSRQR